LRRNILSIDTSAVAALLMLFLISISAPSFANDEHLIIPRMGGQENFWKMGK